jgi:Arc/MetJ family transcription regulator
LFALMRTNIELDDDLLAEAAKYSVARSKRALVREALVAFVTAKSEERRRLTYRDRLQRIRAKTSGTKLRSDTRDLVRRDRDTR